MQTPKARENTRERVCGGFKFSYTFWPMRTENKCYAYINCVKSGPQVQEVPYFSETNPPHSLTRLRACISYCQGCQISSIYDNVNCIPGGSDLKSDLNHHLNQITQTKSNTVNLCVKLRSESSIASPSNQGSTSREHSAVPLPHLSMHSAVTY